VRQRWLIPLRWVPVYGLIRAIKERRRYRTTIYWRDVRDALVGSVCLHALYLFMAIAAVVLCAI